MCPNSQELLIWVIVDYGCLLPFEIRCYYVVRMYIFWDNNAKAHLIFCSLPVWPTVQCTMLCRVHIVACRLIYLIYLMNFSNQIEIWPSAGYLFCFLPDIYLCHQSKHLHFTTMTIYLFLFEGVQFDTVEIYIKTWLNIESIVNTVKA